MSATGNSAECERCGRCLPHCPSYRATLVETFSPRGRWEILRAAEAGELEPGERSRLSLSMCLQCRACSRACPKGVDVAGRILAARTGQVAEGRAVERLALRYCLRHRTTLAKFLRAGALAAPLVTEKKRGGRHFPLYFPEMLAGRLMPEIGKENILTHGKPFYPADPDAEPRGRVTLFTGCFFGVVDSSPAFAAVRALNANGFDVDIPASQSCCGIAAKLTGHADIAREFAAQNLAALQGDHSIVTICATCGGALKREYPYMFAGTPQEDAARRLAGRTRDVMELLAGLPELKAPVSASRNVTVHQPCHLQDMGGAAFVETVLPRLPGVRLMPMDDPGRCCGGGGISGFKNPDISRRTGNAKVEDILNTGAEAVVAGCPGCLLQLKEMFSYADARVSAVHPVELVAGRG